MVRVILGAAVAAVVMLVIGFLIHATPLNSLGSGAVDDGPAAALQSAMAQNLPHTGTWRVPDPGTAGQTVMHGQGPVATIHYNTAGFAAGDAGAYVWALMLNFVAAMLIGAALLGLDRTGADFGTRARLAAIIAVASAAFIHLSDPIYLHHDLGNAVFTMVADALALVAAGVIVAWFMPDRAVRASEEPPRDV